MADLHAAAQEVLAAKGYSGDVDSDLRAALDVRLGMLTRRSIGRVFQCSRSTPSIDELIGGSCVVELGGLPVAQACLLTLFALTSIHEHIRTTPWSGSGVRLVVVLEEAHNLVGRSGPAEASEENADPMAYASEFICRMLAELRALGVAVVIVDQLPSAVAAEVLKNTASKLAFRQVANEDREDLGGTMLFGSLETEEIARLRPGEAYLFTEGYFGPCRIRTPNLQAEFALPAAPLGEAIVPHLSDRPWFAEAVRRRAASQLAALQREADAFDARRIRMLRQAATLVARRQRILERPSAKSRAEGLGRLTTQAGALRDRLDAALRTFRRDACGPLGVSQAEAKRCDKTLRAMRRRLANRIDGRIRKGTRHSLGILSNLIHSCQNDLRNMKEPNHGKKKRHNE